MDGYLTLAAPTKAVFTEKRSKFISFAIPVTTREQARDEVKRISKEYFDARHVCWAFMLGADRLDFLSSDNGEPSGTAGKPILGQINSAELTDVVIIVVRYFGGVKLGTPGLIAAYREAARLAIAEGEIIQCHKKETFSFTFPYLAMNDVMKVIKSADLEILSQTFDNACSMTLSMRADSFPEITGRLLSVDGVSVTD
ncbi:MAG: YigZ family protein [Muribaculaceae bacterium]|nr:YigZ family protein [Muribaculaceae bacterium]